MLTLNILVQCDQCTHQLFQTASIFRVSFLWCFSYGNSCLTLSLEQLWLNFPFRLYYYFTIQYRIKLSAWPCFFLFLCTLLMTDWYFVDCSLALYRIWLLLVPLLLLWSIKFCSCNILFNNLCISLPLFVCPRPCINKWLIMWYYYSVYILPACLVNL